jgi:UDP-N-acetylmuramoyl-tripeptide--D-alanyl-D-alanine ligase
MRYATAHIAAVLTADILGRGDRVVTEVVNDHRALPSEGGMLAALKGARTDGHAYVEAAAAGGAAAALVRRDRVGELQGLADRVDLIAVDDVEEALWKLAVYHRSQYRGRVVAVTGSCGKTTTRAMLQSVLDAVAGRGCATRGNQNNLLGAPMTVCRLDLTDPYLLAEIGTNAFGEIPRLAKLVQPQVGIITGVMRAHMEGFGDVRGVLKEKAALAQAIPADGAVIIPSGDALLMGDRGNWSCRVVTFGTQDADDVRILEAREGVQASGRIAVGGAQLDVRLPVPGVFNLRNAAAALAAVHALGFDVRDGVDALSTFQAEKMRMETRSIRGVTFVVDAYNANPDSMKAALDTLAGFPGLRRAAVMGSMFELGPHSPALHEEVGRHAGGLGLSLLVCVGAHAPAYAAGARAVGSGLLVVVAESHEEAALAVRSWMQEGDVVLVKGSRGSQMERVTRLLEEGAR